MSRNPGPASRVGSAISSPAINLSSRSSIPNEDIQRLINFNDKVVAIIGKCHSDLKVDHLGPADKQTNDVNAPQQGLVRIPLLYADFQELLLKLTSQQNDSLQYIIEEIVSHIIPDASELLGNHLKKHLVGGRNIFFQAKHAMASQKHITLNPEVESSNCFEGVDIFMNTAIEERRRVANSQDGRRWVVIFVYGTWGRKDGGFLVLGEVPGRNLRRREEVMQRWDYCVEDGSTPIGSTPFGAGKGEVRYQFEFYTPVLNI